LLEQPTQTLLNNIKFMEQMARSRPEPVRDDDIRQAAYATSSTSAMKHQTSIQRAAALPGPKVKPETYIRTAGGESWEDKTLLEWDPSNYFCCFCCVCVCVSIF
jgi:hypothetical protein